MTTENTQGEQQGTQQGGDQEDQSKQGQQPGGEPKVELNLPSPAPEVEQPTGDARQDVAFGWLKANGVTRASPAVKHAVETGDFSLLEAVLAEKGVKGFEPYVNLLKDSRTDAESKAASAKAASKTAILGVFETDAAWDEARAWVGQNADEGERAVLSGMLNGGNPVAARIAARFIQQAKLAASGSAPRAGSALKKDAVRSGGPSGGALSPQDYSREVAKLVREHGDRAAFDRPEMRELRSRRALWRG
jgi:hypothetical protein